MAAAEALGVSDLRIARVWDATAVRGARTHEIGGRNWTFIPGEPTEIPLAIARLVAHIEAFRVEGPEGEVYTATPAPAAAKAVGAPALRNDQVIADLDELTIQALRERAQKWGDHPGFDPGLSKGALVRFIMERQAEAAARPPEAAAGDPAGDDGDELEFDPESDGEAGGLTMAEISAKLAQQRAEAAA